MRARHSDDAHTHTVSVAVIHRVGASFRPCFLELYSKPQGARTTSRCGSRRLGIVSIYPYCAHTAEEPVGDGPRGRCYGPVNPGNIVCYQGGKGLKNTVTWYFIDFLVVELHLYTIYTHMCHVDKTTVYAPVALVKPCRQRRPPCGSLYSIAHMCWLVA